MIPDDHPWPEIGSVSRGATRGNQGSKGSLSPPGPDGRCVLQLRVQPGVLAVALTRQASDHYRILDDAVTSALKLTKGFWRKARRRQDYDAQADQDHIELNEWLQQLKDKVMAHLEMLIAKGEIRGPPYVMSDDQEFPFLRKFIERQRTGTPHNPRLRGLSPGNEHHSQLSVGVHRSETPEDSRASTSFVDNPARLLDEDHNGSSSTVASQSGTRSRIATWDKDVAASKQEIDNLRRVLFLARKETHGAFQKFTQAWEAERKAQAALAVAEDRRGELINSFMEHMSTNHHNMLSYPPPPVNGSPVHPDARVPTQFTPTLPAHQTLASPSFATPNRQPMTSPLSGWDNDRQDRPGPGFQNPQMTVQHFQTSNNERQPWQPDARMTLNGQSMGSGDPSGMRQGPMPLAPDFMSELPVNRARKRDWPYGSIEDPEDVSGVPPRKRAHQTMGLRVQTVSNGLHMPTPDDAMSASQPSAHSSAHLSAQPTHYRDTPTG